jgi:catechol 2,3-dioxygenase-like lactoylglutathione lyase family enzyme
MAHQKIRLVRLAHVHYIHANLDRALEFLKDFGLNEVEVRSGTHFFRGYGTEPFVYSAAKGDHDEFGGASFVVESMSDLELASTTLPNATAIHALNAPGGGQRVTFYDPIDKFPMHLVYGQTAAQVSADYPELPSNYPLTKHRPVNSFKRLQPGPAPVHKLGHYGCCVTDFAAAFEFYTTRFNFKPSDIVYEGDRDITTFLHLDRGMEQVDHHTFFFFQGQYQRWRDTVRISDLIVQAGPKFHVHHASFEVHDMDVQALGHQWLSNKGYELEWGVGRHVLGSQVFDYWYLTHCR